MRAALIILCCLVAGIAHAGTPREDFDKAKDAFRKKDCDSARPSLKDVLYPPRLADRDSLFEARVMLGACYADAGERDLAKEEFEKALQLKPREVLDSLFYSERAVRLFDDTKADIENRAKKDVELRELQAQKERVEAAIRNLRVYKSNYYILNFAPFGIGQYQNGQNAKALLFAGGQVAALGTSVGIWYYLVNRYGIRSTQVPLDEGPGVRRLQQIEIGAGLVFYGLWGWSIIDALRHYEPNRRLAGDDELLRQIKQETTDKQKKPQKSSFFNKLHLTPMASPSGVGIGIGWEN
jgi:tetratricopeptide (TPR) repeat protein